MAAIYDFEFVGEILGNNENLMVFITVQNLVAIALVILIIEKFEYFAPLA